MSLTPRRQRPAPRAPRFRSVHLALQRTAMVAVACWNHGMLCAAASYILFALSAFCVKLTHGAIRIACGHTCPHAGMHQGCTPRCCKLQGSATYTSKLAPASAMTRFPPLLSRRPMRTAGRIPVLELCFVRSGLSFMLSVILMRSMKVTPMFGHRKNAPLLVARGVCGALNMTVYYASLQLLPLGDAVTIGVHAAKGKNVPIARLCH